MTRLVLHATALKIINKGGGLVDRREKEKDTVTGKIMKVIRRYKEKGTEYMTLKEIGLRSCLSARRR